MSQELKPCPFCGKDAFITSDDWHGRASDRTVYWVVGCNECPVSLRNHFYSESDAIAAWNTRATDARAAKLAGLLREVAAFPRGKDAPGKELLDRIDVALGGGGGV